MGRLRKRHNWKARQETKVDIDTTLEKQIPVVEGAGVTIEKTDEANALVLPSRKRKTVKRHDGQVSVPLLSKKQRKHLEKIVERHKKKKERADLLAALQQHQVSSSEQEQFTSISAVQTEGLKKRKLSSIRISRKKRRLEKKKAKDSQLELEDDSEYELANEDKNRVNFSVIGLKVGVDSESSDEEYTSEDSQKDSSLVVEGKPKDQNVTAVDNEGEAPLDSSSELITQRNHTRKTEGDAIEPTVFVPVHRAEEVQQQRSKLPIFGEEQAVIEAVRENPVVIVAGETGSGKTTQVPQFLYEAGYALKGMIGVTEPRRVAAISMSQRVAYEMSLSKDIVSYQIRYDGNVTPDTKIKFMTDGVLLKEIQKDFLLKSYSVIILDEAHERSVFTDVLIGLLSRILPIRAKRGPPLKLLIMSATLRIEDFVENTRLFRSPPPVITVDSRQFPVTVHFNKQTPSDYVEEAFRKVCKIHRRLPEGGILIFLTGQQEVNHLCRLLKRTFPFHATLDSEDNVDSQLDKTIKAVKHKRHKVPLVHLEDFPLVPLDEQTGDEDLGLGDDELLDDDMDSFLSNCQSGLKEQPIHVLPLYSILPSHRQAEVFKDPPEGSRLCVVATNVAETSLTIPHIKYVVDCGKQKMRVYDQVTGVSTFHVDWTSQASANQRAGRAGRVGPGHCYRLYSSAVFKDEMQIYSEAEIQRKPIDDLLLQMKALNIRKVCNFPFPSPPKQENIEAAERRLILLGALEDNGKGDFASGITGLGMTMASLPVSPRFGKMLSLSHQQGLLPLAVWLVAAMTVPELLLERPLTTGNAQTSAGPDKDDRKRLQALRCTWVGQGDSLLLGDAMVLLKAVGAAEHASCSGPRSLSKFCAKYGLREKAVIEVRKLRRQLTSEINLLLPNANLPLDPFLQPPTPDQMRLLRQLLLSGLVDQVAKKMGPGPEREKKQLKRAYQMLGMEDPAWIHPSSVLFTSSPEFLIFLEAFQSNKVYLRGVVAIEPEWLPTFAPKQCNILTPLEDPPPSYDSEGDRVVCWVTGTFGKEAWELPRVRIEHPDVLDRFRWFGVFFLDGSIVPSLKKFSSSLLSPPSTMVKSWARLQSRTNAFLQALISRRIDTRRKLEEAWSTDNTCLLKEYLAWVPPQLHNDVYLSWPPLNKKEDSFAS
ncbi:unnamed protein product [Darwinula stevensoni]|uniref:RNA helicase n=1 Tax=Darwinula stevensoni TaxID=69355 RepID=A0A7R9A6U8_9CRUS|nr:unnamed protein product [Darwinula stevensoni]CAG0890412.1 unnamed protein product [Darwinula stevensoni]